LEEPATAYVAHTIGAFRIDTIGYRGGKLAAVADLLEHFYCDVPALADVDGDGIFTIAELVALLRVSRSASFSAWADPRMRKL
jgi:hypothetical protein